MDGAMDDGEFQEADILWPDDTPRDELLPPPFEPSEPNEAAASVSRCAPPAFRLGRRLDESSSFFLPGAHHQSSSADVDEEEWQEADVLWPDTVDEARSWSGGSLWPFRAGFGPAGRHVKPAARREGWAPGVSSSPIDIPANVAARRRVGVAMDRRRL